VREEAWGGREPFPAFWDQQGITSLSPQLNFFHRFWLWRMVIFSLALIKIKYIIMNIVSLQRNNDDNLRDSIIYW